MPHVERTQYRGREIEVTVDDDGTRSATVDGAPVPVRRTDKGWAVAYSRRRSDLMDAVKGYVRDVAITDTK